MTKTLAKIASFAFATCIVAAFAGCAADKGANSPDAPDQAAHAEHADQTEYTEHTEYTEAVILETADDVKSHLLTGNQTYVANDRRVVETSQDIRTETTENGQSPYAVVVTCSDSRVPAEHIFNAGIGELFVIRTAGNVVGGFELGSVEYGAEHLGCPLVVILGHTHCGAVDAALSGGAHGNISLITEEISAAIGGETDPRAAEEANVRDIIATVEGSEIMSELISHGSVEVVGAIYDIETGEVRFLE